MAASVAIPSRPREAEAFLATAMALATKCPHCNTIFRVAADQLKIRGGIVRCGSCKEVFDGNATLLDSAALQPFTAQAAQPSSPLSPEPEAGAARIAPLVTQEPLSGLALDDASDLFEILLDPPPAEPGDADVAPELEPAAQSWPMPEPQPDPWPAEPFGEPEPELTEDGVSDSAEQELPAEEPEEIVAVALSDYDMVEAAVVADSAAIHGTQPGEPEPAADERQAGLAQGEEQPADDPQAEAHQAEDEAAEAPEAEHELPEAAARQDSADPALLDEPGFVKQGRRRARTARAVRILMGFGSLVLFIALLIQGVNTYRNELAAQLPKLKPTLVSICDALGCRIELPAKIEFITIEQGELQAVAENVFSYQSMLRNKSTSVQAWPHIELILNDGNDKPVLRRVVTPGEYLSTPAEPGAGFPPRSEQAVKLYFELAQLQASGYHIAVFYP